MVECNCNFFFFLSGFPQAGEDAGQGGLYGPLEELQGDTMRTGGSEHQPNR